MYKILLTSIRTFIILLLLSGIIDAGRLIILEEIDNQDSKTILQNIKTKISSNELLKKFKLTEDKILKISTDDKNRLVILGPLPDNKKFALIYFEIKKIFPNAIAISSLAINEPKIKKEIIYKDIEIQKDNSEDWLLWIALFALAITGILALFFSSLQLNKITKQHKVMLRRQKEMERKQHELFSNMGKNIYSMSKEVIENTQKVISNIGEKVPKELKQVVDTENKILYTANNLLEFLQIKAKKIKIEHKKFKINNMLDDIVGSFVDKYPNMDLELILDIEHQVPIYAIGDFTNSVTILRNLIEHQFSVIQKGELVVSIFLYKEYQDGLALQIKITPYGVINDTVDAKDYFLPDLISNESENSSRIGLFVAYELIHLLNGDIIVTNLKDGGVGIELYIPIELTKDEKQKYKLPSRKYMYKSIYIVNKHYYASLAQKNLFSYFKYKVTIDSAENFLDNKPNLSDYDIVLIDNDLIYHGFDTYVQMLKDKYDVKMVNLLNILKGDKLNPYSINFDKRVKKPLTQEHVLQLIKSLYSDDTNIQSDEEHTNQKFKRDFIADIAELPFITVEDLADFSNTKVLIVENQKMITTVLNRAGILTDIASNGEEAIEIIKNKGINYYDLILMDINMPIMDGFTATKKIREMEGAERLPIISLTALVLDHEIERMRKSGMDAFLPKPINIGKLYKVFEIFIGKQSHKKQNTKINELQISDIDGLDIKRGLSNSNSNIILYKEILKEFIEVYGGSDNAMMTLYKQKKFDALKQLSLDLMGITGTIGAKELYKTANEIYKLFLYNKLSLLPIFLRDYSRELKKVEKGIKQLLSK